MIRPSRLDRRLDAALAPVRRDLQDLTLAVDDYRADAVVTANSRVADAEDRVTAATAQAGERVLHAERRAADAVAAVQAELAEARGESVRAGIADLVAERDRALAEAEAAIRQRDMRVGEVEHLQAEVQRLTLALDETQRQHDEQRARADGLERWQYGAVEVIHGWELIYEALGRPGRLGEFKSASTLAAVQALVVAARAVLPDLADALPHRPKGGSRTRARRRLEALAAVLDGLHDHAGGSR